MDESESDQLDQNLLYFGVTVVNANSMITVSTC